MLKPIGFFGGSFSPIHCGHIRMVFTLLEGSSVARVILVPAADAYKKPGLLSATERLERVRSVFAPLGQVVEISTIDTDKPYFPHPMETAQELATRYLDRSSEELQQGDAFICPSTADLAATMVHLKSDQIRLLHIPYPIPDVYFQNQYDRVETSNVLSRFGIDVHSQTSWLLYSGRLNQQKNIHLALRVIHALTQMNYSIGFLIVGKEDTSGFPELGWDNVGYENDLRRLAEELQIQDRVYFLGTVDRKTMYDLYHCVDIHLTCSTFRTEDFGFVPIEAMACGVPTVSTAWGGFWDTVQHEITGYRVPVYLTPMGFLVDWRAAVLRIVRILSDAKLRSYLRRACRAYAQTHFTLNLFRERMLNAIDKLTQQRRERFHALDLASLVDDDTKRFFNDLENRSTEFGSVLVARKGLYAGSNSARVATFFAEYARSQPIRWSSNTVVYIPLPLKVEGHEIITLDRNWPSTTILSNDELRFVSQIDQAGNTLSQLASAMSLTFLEIVEVCEAMMKKGIVIPLDEGMRV